MFVSGRQIKSFFLAVAKKPKKRRAEFWKVYFANFPLQMGSSNTHPPTHDFGYCEVEVEKNYLVLKTLWEWDSFSGTYKTGTWKNSDHCAALAIDDISSVTTDGWVTSLHMKDGTCFMVRVDYKTIMKKLGGAKHQKTTIRNI
jgi:hypothetical protein